MKLTEALNSCIGKRISNFKIGDDKLFPFDNGSLTLKEHGVDGYYNIMSDEKSIILLSIRDKNYDCVISYYNDDRIRSIYFNNGFYKIYF